MKEIGDLGEKLVGRWLQLNEHEILQRNWRCRWGEIDLIAQHKKSSAIAFIEVKTRGDRNWDVDGMLAVNARKQQKLIQTASLFLTKHPHLAELPCSFDVACVSCRSLNPVNEPFWQTIDVEIDRICELEINQSIIVLGYQLAIAHYLAAAFD